MRRSFLLLCAIALALPLSAQTPAARVVSPDGQVELRLLAGPELTYEVSYRGRPVVLSSQLGLELQGQPPLGPGLRLDSTKPGSADESYRVPHGKSNPVRNHYNSVLARFSETGRMQRQLGIDVRAYNDGVAFRYVIPEQPAIRELRLTKERTQFQLAKDGQAYPLILSGFRTSYEDNYHVLPLSGIHPTDLIALPFLVHVPDVAWVAITEAHLEDWAGMYLSRNARGPRTLEARLAPRADEPELAVSGATPMSSPWRVLMIGSEPGRLIESNIVINLNPPSVIGDTSWIQPGKTAWNWWSGSVAKDVSFEPGMNTDTMKHYIEFASQAKFKYMLIDAGWAAPGERAGADITRTVPSIDMPEILRYARSKNVKIWLWAHWTSVDRQMDEAFPLFEKWGVAGVKIDFMDRDDQWMVNFYHRVLKKAAECHLMIDFHGAYKPAGVRRTYPNLVTREGVMGMEYSKWSARDTPFHSVILAFTRMLAGPMDFTPGGFNNATEAGFVPRQTEPMVMGTRAQQLALYVVFESPLQMVSDYPEAYKGQKELAFLSEVPTTWDETRVINARVGEYITIARRHGHDWYVGSITNWDPRDLEIPLRFLGSGKYVAEIYADAPDSAEFPKHTTLERQDVDQTTTLRVKLAPGGGNAIRIHPAE